MTEEQEEDLTLGPELALRVRSLIDLTDLADDHSPAGIEALCERAMDHGTAAVCVWPEFVPRCAARLRDSPVRVATVVNFPSGAEPLREVEATTRRALAEGADDIDVVLPYRALMAGDASVAADLLRATRAAVEAPAILKVILETGELASPDRIAEAARMALDVGADFLKTSTGKTPIGATHEAAHLMLAAIRESGRPAGLKPSGGIRTVHDAGTYLRLADDMMGPEWATPARFRFGASGLLDDVARWLDGSAAGPVGDGY